MKPLANKSWKKTKFRHLEEEDEEEEEEEGLFPAW